MPRKKNSHLIQFIIGISTIIVVGFSVVYSINIMSDTCSDLQDMLNNNQEEM